MIFLSSVQLRRFYTSHFIHRHLQVQSATRRSNLSPLFYSRSMSNNISGVSGLRELAATLEQPLLDDRKYRYIELPNHLRVLLVHDKNTDKSAASLDVNVGAFEDPEDLPGLAHFCEHLLFMGSKKFPNENEYASFLSKHGGASNAYTASQNTNYYFHVNHENLYDALDRFSGFFSCPLFNESSTEKEIKAVDSENKKNLQNDMWRLYQLGKSLTNPIHPYHKFSTGNFETLWSIPRSKGVNVRDELLKFYNRSYSANLMKLVILGREDLDTLAQWAYELFKDVPNHGTKVPEYHAQAFTPEHLMKVIKVKPVKNLKSVEISFVVPDMDKHWQVKPARYLSHLIGHEGTDSLLAYLKNNSWAIDLSAGATTVSEGNAYFSVNVDLTDEGVVQYEAVICAVFQYINMLKEVLPQEWVFTELKDIGEAHFKFKQKGNPAATVSSLSKNLQKAYLPVQVILNTSLMRQYEPGLIMEYLNSLTLENSRVMLISQKVETNLSERWYGTEYSVADYTKDFVSKIRSLGANPALKIPAPNEFIATRFDVHKDEGNVKPLLEPFLLRDDRCGKLWYKKDDMFWVPKGYIYISMKLPHTHSSIVNSMLCTLYVDHINDSLKDLAYNAECAGLEISLRKTNQGLDLSLSGYNDKLLVLLARFFEGIQKLFLREERFMVLKQRLIQKLHNHLYDTPYTQIGRLYSSLINERSWTTQEKLDITEQLTFDHLANFVPTIYEQMYFELLVHGNFSHEEALEVYDLVSSLVPNEIRNSEGRNSKLRSYFIPAGGAYHYETALADKENVNSCIQKVIQLGAYSELLSAKGSLLAQMVNEPCFNTLRTEEQLGYVVFSSKLNTHGTVNLRILVQSERSSSYLESRIDNFLSKFGSTLEMMSDAEFEKHKDALCKTLQQKYRNLGEENDRYVTCIYLGDYNFLYKERKAQLVRQLTKKEMLDFYQQTICSKQAASLVVHMQAQAGVQDSPADKVDGYPTGNAITDVGAFKSQLYLAPIRAPIKKFEVTTPKL
ncbi:AER053Cp [Eremothecium gossypii ATCC 10895]|uniref:AER053Cp n=1 Tax=Eremothecium gossypii (strain ATCC 10895 / CBS 109.51 / FGSC 9923 / NRRL Y-1056) TaxID=284811 RepID=Q757G0_EREGS|nr:AER053Cp [Eremothecium gossypii ATCC 10895]AAS52737.2 AER053Cp [Eremothecium gossypii ATCC 10895]AEY97043.1 FAER053Cp [Eremothecium gossypii FDAG1]